MKYLSVSSVLRVITIVMLLFTFVPQSYDYYYTLRLAVCFTGAYLTYVAFLTKNYAWIVAALFLIVLFNPFYLLPIKKDAWQRIDIGVSIVLAASVFFLGEKVGQQSKPTDDLSVL